VGSELGARFGIPQTQPFVRAADPDRIVEKLY
jgi:hypothetical protein